MKKYLITLCAVLITLAVLLRISFVYARSSLKSGIVQSRLDSFVPQDTKLSVEPNTGYLCWSFIQASWADAQTVNVSLFGNPISFGTIKWIKAESE